MRWPTPLFLLLGAVIGVSAAIPECTRNELPAQDLTCEINWRSRTEKEALATCLEYIPTTFVKGKMNGDKTECSIQVAYQCAGKHKAESFIMFDKCYWFPKTNGKYIEGKITDHASACDDGELSVFYSSTHAKFLGMKAHSMGIDKIWIGIDAEGKSIVNPELMIHKKLWKLVEGDYWKSNDELQTFPKDGEIPAEASHYFMRTRTDYVNNRWQGSFERANGANFNAAYVCHTEAKFNDKQQWYCDKMGKDGLGLDAVFDPGNVAMREKPRCLYVSASSYTFNGKFDDMAKGCKERPSTLHSAGMDDGAAGHEHYSKFQNKGPLRIAAFRIDRSNTEEGGEYPKQKCTGTPHDGWERRFHFTRWRHIDHNANIQKSFVSQIRWNSNYPMNECSDFPGESITMGVKDGMKIDMPPEVRAPAICSIGFFQECENNKKNNKILCEGDLVCTNERTYGSDRRHREIENPNDPEQGKWGFYSCDCPKRNAERWPNGNSGDEPYEIDTDKRTCNWKKPGKCAWLDYVSKEGKFISGLPDQWLDDNDNRDVYEELINGKQLKYETLQQVVVRKGCTLSARTFGKYRTGNANVDLVYKVGYGTHEVPTEMNKKLLRPDWSMMGVFSVQCWC